MTVPFTFQKTDRGSVVSVFVNGSLEVADDSHPNWTHIMRELRKEDPDADTLARLLGDASEHIAEDLSTYTDRVEINHGKVYLDGEKIGGRLPEKIVQVYNRGESPKALVKFLENLSGNPSHRSREQLFAYLEKHDFQITDDGAFVAYKGIREDGKSVSSGTAFVDGEKVTGRIPNEVGSVITMPRTQISDDPTVACHVGLHAGAWSYASTFGSSGCTAKVKVFPQHVVSVPADHNQTKIRTEQYEVLEVNVEEEHDYDEPYYTDWELDEVYEEAYYEGYAKGQVDAANGAWF